MPEVCRAVREHLHFVMVATLLSLVVTYTTIVFEFRADVVWLPTGNSHDET